MSSLPGELPTKIDFNLVLNIQTYEEKNYCELAAELQNRKNEIDKIGCEIAIIRFSLY